MPADMQHLFLRELELNGVNLNQLPWLSSPIVAHEINKVLSPVVHEGKILSMGLIFAENALEFGHLELIHLSIDQLDMARKLTDGIEWFLLFHQDQFFGMVRFKDAIRNDLALIRAFPSSGGLLLQRNAYGETRFYQGQSLITHHNRSWSSKPSIMEALWTVSKCIPGIDKRVLTRILEFSFFIPSSENRFGAILVWFLNSPNLKIKNLEDLQLSIMDESHTSLIKHILCQMDGATYLSPDGKIVNIGSHLKVSERSRGLIGHVKGTRHTSAIRFSYDVEDTLVITISEDGPVTLFFQGTSIADLQIHSVFQKARDLQEATFEKESVRYETFEIACSRCHKNSMTEEIRVEGKNKECSISCPTCSETLYSSNCFSLECRPYRSKVS